MGWVSLTLQPPRWDDTLVVFTSDHETGGLALGGVGSALQPLWATADHTGSAVPLLAYGPTAKIVVGPHPDRVVGRLLLQLVEADWGRGARRLTSVGVSP